MDTVVLIFLFSVMVYAGNGMKTGGWSDVVDLNSSDIQTYSKFATEKVSASTNSPYHLKWMSTKSASKQVVSGMNYQMEIVMGKSECRKNENKSKEELEICPVQKCKPPMICNVIVWVQEWMPEPMKLTHQHCQPGKSPC